MEKLVIEFDQLGKVDCEMKQEHVEAIAMESTGVYWKIVLNMLSETIPILLVITRKIKALSGNKTDIKDSTRLCKLLLKGLLQGGLTPFEKPRNLLYLNRHQTKSSSKVRG